MMSMIGIYKVDFEKMLHIQFFAPRAPFFSLARKIKKSQVQGSKIRGWEKGVGEVRKMGKRAWVSGRPMYDAAICTMRMKKKQKAERGVEKETLPNTFLRLYKAGLGAPCPTKPNTKSMSLIIKFVRLVRSTREQEPVEGPIPFLSLPLSPGSLIIELFLLLPTTLISSFIIVLTYIR